MSSCFREGWRSVCREGGFYLLLNKPPPALKVMETACYPGICLVKLAEWPVAPTPSVLRLLRTQWKGKGGPFHFILCIHHHWRKRGRNWSFLQQGKMDRSSLHWGLEPKRKTGPQDQPEDSVRMFQKGFPSTLYNSTFQVLVTWFSCCLWTWVGQRALSQKTCCSTRVWLFVRTSSSSFPEKLLPGPLETASKLPEALGGRPRFISW